MEKVYEHSTDIHLAAVVLYGDSSTKKVYVDSKKSVTTETGAKERVYDLFKKGRLVVDMGDVLYKPVSCDETNNKLTVITISSAAASPVELVLQ